MALVHPIAILTIHNNQYFKSNRNIAPSQKALRRIKLTRLIKCTHVTHIRESTKHPSVWTPAVISVSHGYAAPCLFLDSRLHSLLQWNFTAIAAARRAPDPIPTPRMTSYRYFINVCYFMRESSFGRRAIIILLFHSSAAQSCRISFVSPPAFCGKC